MYIGVRYTHIREYQYILFTIREYQYILFTILYSKDLFIYLFIRMGAFNNVMPLPPIKFEKRDLYASQQKIIKIRSAILNRRNLI
jgi:hypothetical protein